VQYRLMLFQAVMDSLPSARNDTENCLLIFNLQLNFFS
jgi:hypothetical protein